MDKPVTERRPPEGAAPTVPPARGSQSTRFHSVLSLTCRPWGSPAGGGLDDQASEREGGPDAICQWAEWPGTWGHVGRAVPRGRQTCSYPPGLRCPVGSGLALPLPSGGVTHLSVTCRLFARIACCILSAPVKILPLGSASVQERRPV